MLASFFIPFLIMAIIYLSIGIYPGSSRSVLASDAFSQFSNFHASFNNVLHGKQSLFYTWNASLGLNYLSLISYYLGGLFTPLVFFFNNQNMPDALYFLTLLKIGSAGLSFWFLAKQTFKIPKWSHVTLSVSYAHCGPFRINYVAGCLYLSATRNFRNSSFNGPTKTDIIVCQLFLAFHYKLLFWLYDWVVFLPVLFCTNVYRLATI